MTAALMRPSPRRGAPQARKERARRRAAPPRRGDPQGASVAQPRKARAGQGEPGAATRRAGTGATAEAERRADKGDQPGARESGSARQAESPAHGAANRGKPGPRAGAERPRRQGTPPQRRAGKKRTGARGGGAAHHTREVGDGTSRRPGRSEADNFKFPTTGREQRTANGARSGDARAPPDARPTAYASSVKPYGFEIPRRSFQNVLTI